MLSRDKEVPHHVKASKSNSTAPPNDSRNASAKQAPTNPPNKNLENGVDRHRSAKRKANNLEDIKCRNCQMSGGTSCECLHRDKSLGHLSIKTSKLSNETKTTSHKNSHDDAKLLSRPTVKKAELEPHENQNRRHTSKAEKCSDRDLWLFASIPALNHPDFNPDQKKFLLSLARIYTDVSPGRKYNNMWTRTSKLISIHHHDKHPKSACKSAKSTKSTKPKREDSVVKRKNSIPTAVDIFENGQKKENKVKSEEKRSKSLVKSASKPKSASLAKEVKDDSKAHRESPPDEYVNKYVIGIIKKEAEVLKSQNKSPEKRSHDEKQQMNGEVDTKASENKTVFVTDSRTTSQTIVFNGMDTNSREKVIGNERMEIVDIEQSDTINYSAPPANQIESVTKEKEITTVTVTETDLKVDDDVQNDRIESTIVVTETSATDIMEIEDDYITKEEHFQDDQSESLTERAEEIEQNELITSEGETKKIEAVVVGDTDTMEEDRTQKYETELVAVVIETSEKEIMREYTDMMKEEEVKYEDELVTKMRATNETEVVKIEENITTKEEVIQNSETELVAVVIETSEKEIMREYTDMMKAEEVKGGENEIISSMTTTNEMEVAVKEEKVQNSETELVAVVIETSEKEIMREYTDMMKEEEIKHEDNVLFADMSEKNEMAEEKVEDRFVTKEEGVQNSETELVAVVIETSEKEIMREYTDMMKEEEIKHEESVLFTDMSETNEMAEEKVEDRIVTKEEDAQNSETELVAVVIETSEKEIMREYTDMMKEEEIKHEENVLFADMSETNEMEEEKVGENVALNEDEVQNSRTEMIAIVSESRETEIVKIEDHLLNEEEVEIGQNEAIASVTEIKETNLIEVEKNDTIQDQDVQDNQTEVIMVVVESTENEVSKEEEKVLNDHMEEIQIEQNQMTTILTETEKLNVVKVEEVDTIKDEITEDNQTEVVTTVTEVIQEENIVNDQIEVIGVVTESSEIEIEKLEEDKTVIEEEVQNEQNEKITNVTEINDIINDGTVEDNVTAVTGVLTESSEIEIVQVNESVVVKEEEVQNEQSEGISIVTEAKDMDTVDAGAIDTDNQIEVIAVVLESSEIEVLKVDDEKVAVEELHESDIVTVHETDIIEGELVDGNETEVVAVVVTESSTIEVVKEVDGDIAVEKDEIQNENNEENVLNDQEEHVAVILESDAIIEVSTEEDNSMIEKDGKIEEIGAVSTVTGDIDVIESDDKKEDTQISGAGVIVIVNESSEMEVVKVEENDIVREESETITDVVVTNDIEVMKTDEVISSIITVSNEIKIVKTEESDETEKNGTENIRITSEQSENEIVDVRVTETVIESQVERDVAEQGDDVNDTHGKDTLTKAENNPDSPDYTYESDVDFVDSPHINTAPDQTGEGIKVDEKEGLLESDQVPSQTCPPTSDLPNTVANATPCDDNVTKAIDSPSTGLGVPEHSLISD